MSDDLRTQARKWFVETGYVDGGGIGHWDSTKESVEVESEAAANALRDEWLDQGKLIKTSWGELLPTFGYGIFRIRSIWVDVQNPVSDRIAAAAQIIVAASELHEEGIAYWKGELRKAEARADALADLLKQRDARIGELVGYVVALAEKLEMAVGALKAAEEYMSFNATETSQPYPLDRVRTTLTKIGDKTDD